MTSDIAIQTNGLTKEYGHDNVAVRDLSMTIRRGEVYGFIGPNGAGKTTFMRMLVGLIRPTAGTATVLGFKAGSTQALARVGAVIENPSFYPHLSGRDNLRVMGLYSGVPAGRIDDVLEQVDLAGRSHDQFQTYSMGMKQRLGLAAALLKDPDVLILDEPTNGLDPQGIAEMRTLLRSLGEGRRTVMLSSHLMTEVEQVCDRIGVIRSGSLIAEGTVDGLRGEPELRLKAIPECRAHDLLSQLPYVTGIRSIDGALLVSTEPCHVSEINRLLVSDDIAVRELTPTRSSIEQTYLDILYQDGMAAHE